MMMRYKYQRVALLASILWVVNLAAAAQVATAVSTGTSATTAAPTSFGLSRSLTLGSVPAPSQISAPDQTAVDTRASDQSDSSPRTSGRINDQPSNFQRFVQQATGRALAVYGQNLFSSPSSYAPISQAPVPNDYILGPGDEVRLQVWGAIDAEQSLVINRHGQINLPKVGVINLTGVRAGDLESVLRSKIGRVFTNFNLNATLGRLRSIQIYVVGQTRQPGTYTVFSLSTLINALFEVGGPGNNGSMQISS